MRERLQLLYDALSHKHRIFYSRVISLRGLSVIILLSIYDVHNTVIIPATYYVVGLINVWKCAVMNFEFQCDSGWGKNKLRGGLYLAIALISVIE